MIAKKLCFHKNSECLVLIGEKIANLEKHCKGASKIIAVADRNVLRLHRRALSGIDVIPIDASEKGKTLATVEKIYSQFLARGVDRSSFIVGIGGGITSDIAGFAAATYLRGIPFGLVPTTLLSQADASVGGKTGVNFSGYKNLVGTFTQPRFVLCDFAFLRTLPKKEISCGLSEMIKHAAIADARHFAYLEKNMGRLLALEMGALEKAVSRSVEIKAGIVQSDEFEGGARMKLNFGHTLGHAMEKVCGLAHGEAISIGMAAAAKLSVKRGKMPAGDAQRLCSLLSAAGLPISLPKKSGTGKIIDAMEKDKKRRGGAIRMVLLGKLGRAYVSEVGILELEGILDDMC